MRRQYKIITLKKKEIDEDVCGTFFTIICLITSKIWGNFEVINIKRVKFYE